MKLTSNKIRIIVVIFCFGILVGEALLIRAQTSPQISSGISTKLGSSAASATKRAPMPSVQIQGDAAIVKDLTTGEVYFAKNSKRTLPLASITKVMTALVAVENYNANSAVTFGNEKWRLKDLIDFTLVTSSNEGAAAIAAAGPSHNSSEFINKMNETAGKIGLTNTHFINETGLDLNQNYGGSYGSAEDVATLFSYVMKHHPETLEATREQDVSRTSLDKRRHSGQNTNLAVNNIPGLLGSKTGYTDLADGNLGVVFDAGLGHPVAVVVLGSTQSGRFSDVEKLVKATFHYLNNYPS